MGDACMKGRREENRGRKRFNDGRKKEDRKYCGK